MMKRPGVVEMMRRLMARLFLMMFAKPPALPVLFRYMLAAH
jgi:hypothetical protein